MVSDTEVKRRSEDLLNAGFANDFVAKIVSGNRYGSRVLQQVKYADGRNGIFDTKKGNTAESEDVKSKAKALQKYIKNQDKNLFGGILILGNESGSIWKLNQEDKYDYKGGNWQILE